MVDNGFILAKSFQFSENIGKLMENLVFSELLKRGYKPNETLFYYKTRNKKEVDFVLKEVREIKNLIQVSFLEGDQTKRETSALIEASSELNCQNVCIITWDLETEEKIKNKKIKFIPLWKWLLME